MSFFGASVALASFAPTANSTTVSPGQTSPLTVTKNLPDNPTFDDIKNRITADVIEEGEILNENDTRSLPRLMLRCFEELSGSEVLTDQQIKLVWNLMPYDKKKDIIRKLNNDVKWL